MNLSEALEKIAKLEEDIKARNAEIYVLQTQLYRVTHEETKARQEIEPYQLSHFRMRASVELLLSHEQYFKYLDDSALGNISKENGPEAIKARDVLYARSALADWKARK